MKDYGLDNLIPHEIQLTIVTVTPPKGSSYHQYTKQFYDEELWRTSTGKQIPVIDFCNFLIKKGNKVEIKKCIYKKDKTKDITINDTNYQE